MKATKILITFRVCLIFIYVLLLGFQIFKDNWFWLFLIFESILLFVKSACFLQDSSLWLGMFLNLCGGFGIVKYIFQFDISFWWPMYILFFGIASLIVFAIFRQNIHLKVFVICAIEVLLLGIYKFAFVAKVEFWYVQIMFWIYLLGQLLVRLAINLRSN